jgi:hypothetical protein
MSEEYEIKKSGAKQQWNSGRGTHEKGDGRLGEFCIDIKEFAKSYSVSRNNWIKITTDAIKSGNLIPALKLVLGQGDMTLRLWVIDDETFMSMYEAWREKYE